MSILSSTNRGLSAIPITVDNLYKLGYIKTSIREGGKVTIFMNSKFPLVRIKHYKNIAWNNYSNWNSEKFIFNYPIESSILENEFWYNQEIKSLHDLAENEKKVINIYNPFGEKKQ